MAHFVTITEEDDKAAAFCEDPDCLWRGDWRYHDHYEDLENARWNAWEDANLDGREHLSYAAIYEARLILGTT